MGADALQNSWLYALKKTLAGVRLEGRKHEGPLTNLLQMGLLRVKTIKNQLIFVGTQWYNELEKC